MSVEDAAPSSLLDFVAIPISNSPIIKYFPWSNGIAEVRGKRLFIERALRAVSPPHPREVIDLVVVRGLSHILALEFTHFWLEFGAACGVYGESRDT